MSSNYVDTEEDRNDGMAEDEPTEQICRRCHGLGEDGDGADCVFCEGYGSVLC